MKKNVVILTSGLSGSSVLTGLITRAGYWTGDATFKKSDYDTFENRRLIELNLRLFQESNYKGNYLLEFSPEAIAGVASLYGKIDDGPYRAFLAECDQHQPWIWKDPRLWLTIRYWQNLLELKNCRFILLTRGTVQSWISSILRKQITTYRYARNYETRIQESAVEFLKEHGIEYLHLTYEGLIVHPVETLERLNRFLDTGLTEGDLKAVYHKPLYKNPRSSLMKHVKAMLIYFKNYSERLDIAG
jgi:hypothetical protein